jgi:hypothetical protein
LVPLPLEYINDETHQKFVYLGVTLVSLYWHKAIHQKKKEIEEERTRRQRTLATFTGD